MSSNMVNSLGTFGSDSFQLVGKFLKRADICCCYRVCKLWNQFSKETLVKSFEDSYQPKRFYNATTFWQVEDFLLAETHGDKKSNPDNGELVSYLAATRPVVLFLESREFMVEIVEEPLIRATMDHFCINAKVQKNIRFFGWDIKKNDEHARLRIQATYLTDYLEVSKQKMKQYIHMKNPETQRKLIEAGKKELAIKALQSIEDCEKQLVQVTQKLADVNRRIMKEVENDCPLRTQSYISALRTVKQWRSEKKFNGIAVFISGTNHLLENRAEAALNVDGTLIPFNKEAWSLKTLREELNGHNAAAIIPITIEERQNFSAEERMQFMKSDQNPMTYSTMT